MIANGGTESFYGEDGIDTVVFPGSFQDYVIF